MNKSNILSVSKILKPVRKNSKVIMNMFHHMINSDIINFRLNYYSQNGEDGMIAEILKRLKIKSGWAVEFGAWDGIYLSNTFNLVEKHDFKAVYIEGDQERYKDLVNTSSKYKDRIVPVCAFVQESGTSSLESLLEKTKIPTDFDILSIDIDSYDYQIWKSFNKYNPKIVLIEVNASIPIDTLHIHGEPGLNGSSYLSMLKLGNSKGYTCVAHSGNMIFIRNDIVVNVVGKNLSHEEQCSLFRLKK